MTQPSRPHEIRKRFLPAMIVALVAACLTSCVSQDDQVVDHVAFGCCLKEDKPAPIFDVINEAKPDIFMFVGDNIYGDTINMRVLQAKYDTFLDRPGIQTLKQQSRILATWDDHDYGRNDAGRDYPKKAESQQIFLDVFDEPASSERRKTPGIYTSYLLGPPEKRLQIILLDNRYFRSDLKKGERVENGGSYAPNPDPAATMLGKEQWAWLEGELKKDARIRMIVGGTQIMREHNGYEAWANFPLELEKLVEVIKRTQAEGVVFLSGDTHWAEFTKRTWPGCYPFHELTSSGLTEVWRYISPNRYRLNDMAFLAANFGSVRIDWNQADPLITFAAIDKEGTERFSHTVHLSELQFQK